MIESPVVDFPQPDSPTRPRHSPAPISNETLSTARTLPSWMRNCVTTSVNRSTGSISRCYR